MNYDNNFTLDLNKTSKYLFGKIKGYSNKEQSWLFLNEFKKESNYQVLLYEKLTNALSVYNDVTVIKKIKRLAANEHIRWNRFHISKGWKYSLCRDDEHKYHDCLTDLNSVPDYKNMYDIVNVALLLNLDNLKE